MSTDPDETLGLRDADLSDAERRARDERLAEDPEAAAAHTFGMDLFDRMAALPDAEVTTAPEGIRKRPGPRRWWMVGAPALALAAALLLWVQAEPPSPTRDRGTGVGNPGLQLEAVARGAGGLRPLRDGDSVGAGEQVLFRVTTQAAGRLSLAEDGAVIHPEAGLWTVGVGAHSPGADSVLGFRTDAGPGPHRYVAELCPEDGECRASGLTLVWEAP